MHHSDRDIHVQGFSARSNPMPAPEKLNWFRASFQRVWQVLDSKPAILVGMGIGLAISISIWIQ